MLVVREWWSGLFVSTVSMRIPLEHWVFLYDTSSRSVINWDEIFITPLLQIGENLQFHEKFWATGSILSRQRTCKSHGLTVENWTKLVPERRNVVVTDRTCPVNGCVWIISTECKHNYCMCIHCGWTGVVHHLYDTHFTDWILWSGTFVKCKMEK
jgi:hypothetical protein